MDTPDIMYQIKKMNFPNQIKNVFTGDYIELFAGMTQIETANDTFNGNIGTSVKTFVLNTSSDVQPVRLYLYSIPGINQFMNSYELVRALNEFIKGFKITYQSSWTAITLPGSPAFSTDFSLANRYNVHNLLMNGEFFLDMITGKMAFRYVPTQTFGNRFDYGNAGDAVVLDDLGAQSYAFGQNTTVNFEYSYEIESFVLQIQPGRDMSEARQNQISQLFGMDRREFKYELGLSSGAKTIYSTDTLGAPLDVTAWNLYSQSLGTYPTDFTIYGFDMMQAQPVKEIYIYSTLGSNYWGKLGDKQAYIGCYRSSKSWAEESDNQESFTHIFSSKENIQAVKNFDIVIRDKYNQLLEFNEEYLIEIAFHLK